MSDSLRPMDCSTPGLPTHHQLPEFTQTHVHWVVIPSNHLILCRPLLLLPSIFLSIRVFSNESVLHIRWAKYWSFSFNISPSNEYSGQTGWISLLSKGLSSLLQHHSSKASIITTKFWNFISYHSERWYCLLFSNLINLLSNIQTYHADFYLRIFTAAFSSPQNSVSLLSDTSSWFQISVNMQLSQRGFIRSLYWILSFLSTEIILLFFLVLSFPNNFCTSQTNTISPTTEILSF